jgi:hypothetical protein
MFFEAFHEIDSFTAEIIETGPGNAGLRGRLTRNSYREFSE